MSQKRHDHEFSYAHAQQRRRQSGDAEVQPTELVAAFHAPLLEPLQEEDKHREASINVGTFDGSSIQCNALVVALNSLKSLDREDFTCIDVVFDSTGGEVSTSDCKAIASAFDAAHGRGIHTRACGIARSWAVAVAFMCSSIKEDMNLQVHAVVLKLTLNPTFVIYGSIHQMKSMIQMYESRLKENPEDEELKFMVEWLSKAYAAYESRTALALLFDLHRVRLEDRETLEKILRGTVPEHEPAAASDIYWKLLPQTGTNVFMLGSPKKEYRQVPRFYYHAGDPERIDNAIESFLNE